MKKTEKEEANLQKKDKNLEKTNEKNKEKIMEIIKKAKKETFLVKVPLLLLYITGFVMFN